MSSIKNLDVFAVMLRLQTFRAHARMPDLLLRRSSAAAAGTFEKIMIKLVSLVQDCVEAKQQELAPSSDSRSQAFVGKVFYVTCR